MNNTLLKVTDLSKNFDMHILNDKHIKALQAVNFDIKEGEVVGLTGKSGSGKSTLMKAIHRTYLPSSGAIHYKSLKFGKVDLARANEHVIIALRKTEITYCSQFLRVIPRVPAVDIVAESIIKKENEREGAREIARDLLDKLGLPKEIWDSFPATFSGGEQQRINVARAIISKPRFLLIDEPTASLDANAKDVVIDLILDMKNYGTSVLCISHDQVTLDKLTDRTIHLENGCVSEKLCV